jgi:hypothetical protein
LTQADLPFQNQNLENKGVAGKIFENIDLQDGGVIASERIGILAAWFHCHHFKFSVKVMRHKIGGFGCGKLWKKRPTSKPLIVAQARSLGPLVKARGFGMTPRFFTTEYRKTWHLVTE